MRATSLLCTGLLIVLLPLNLAAEERTEHFDRDPGWDGHNNRASTPAPRTVRQDFGYSPTSHAGGEPGEMGGLITPAAEPAYYAKRITPKSFKDELSASGTLACTGREFHVLLGFFNVGTLNEWRTPNTLAVRLSGRGDYFYAWAEYATRRWRAGADDPHGFSTRDPATGRTRLIEFPAQGKVYHWSIRYDPRGNNGGGVMTVTLDDQTAICHFAPGHKADGAVFNRFGLLPVLKSADGGGEVWLDDVTVDGETEHFTRDPGWDGYRNRRTYTTTNVRPRFDFGFTLTPFARGEKAGELGGSIFRGDGRFADRRAWYADRVQPLTLEKPLRAGGQVCLRRGVSDSTTLLGFFHSTESTAINTSQDTGFPDPFLGIVIEGPSSEGFFVYPAYRVKGVGKDQVRPASPNRIYPNGAAHSWKLAYDPDAAHGNGAIVVSLDNHSVRLDLGPEHKALSKQFDRFGIITTRIDGNGQEVYFDDLSYTFRQ
jgi:hypothetical protein